jgi:FkbM family methyltransferase
LMLLRWLRYAPGIPVPIRVPRVGWWLARNDACGQAMLSGDYETKERRFVDRVLRAGMTVLDIGAHHGLYTLLASRKVGMQGRVLAFEPSPRERKNLLKHLRLNRCRNVVVEAIALGGQSGLGELFVVEGMETGCNCLRPPDVSEPTTKISTSIETLDGFLAQRGIHRADFIKIDVEGAELEVLRGATTLLKRPPRPIILAEVQELRTAAWGYSAREIVDFLRPYDYRWFRLAEAGLQPLRDDCSRLNENLVAVPNEWALPDLAFDFPSCPGAQSC